MESYWVEGLFVTRTGLKRVKKTGRVTSSDVELFARPVWANSPAEAVELATDLLDGGEWQETPKVSRKTEERQMRSQGAPELPLFDLPKKRKK